MSLSAALEADVAALEADAAVQGYWQRTSPFARAFRVIANNLEGKPAGSAQVLAADVKRTCRLP